MEAAYLHDLHAERLEPGQEPAQGALIPEGPCRTVSTGSTEALSRSKSSRASGGRSPVTRIS